MPPFIRHFISLSLILSLLFAISVQGQNTFNKTIIFTSDTANELYIDHVKIGQKLFMLDYADPFKTIFAEIDDSGEVVKQKILDTAYIYFRAATATPDGKIMATGSKFIPDSNNFLSRTMMLKVDTSFNVLWMKSIDDSVFTDNYTDGFAITTTIDGGFALAGSLGAYAVFYRTDSLGNLKNYHTYGYGGTAPPEMINSLKSLTDGTFIMTGDEGFMTDRNIVVYHLDSTGNILWKKSIGGPYNESFPASVIVGDSILYVVSQYTTKGTWYYHDPVEIKLHLQKFKINGMLLRDTLYGDTDQLYVPERMAILKNGTLVVAGHDLHLRNSWLLCFDENCDSLWFRTYDHEPSFENILYEPIAAEDGGILAFGGILNIYNAITEDIWLFKANERGCFEAGINIISQPSGVTVRRGESATFRISVDPADTVQYQWFRNGEELIGRNDSVLIIDQVTENDTGIYYCRLNGDCGINSSDARLSLNLTGTNDLNQPLFSIFPNPASDHLQIIIPGKERSTVKISDSQGRLLKEFIITGEKNVIYISGFSEGIYFIDASINGQRYFRKFIKR